ncbi:hypothetical protein JW916_06815 [Candidatus Sumerlaeota bacterium]|nr:hypothetical protein [Candidatus Sumerlaeota bacterium]
MQSRILTLAFIMLLAGGCASHGPVDWQEETGLGLCPPWREVGVGREMAREAAIGEAREKIWASMLEMKIDERTRVEDLTLTSPRFLSKFRGMIGQLDPVEVREGEGQSIVVKMRIDKNAVLRLARRYMLSARTQP